MSFHLTGKRLKSSAVGEPGRDFLFTLNIKITHQDRKGLSSRGPLQAPACGHRRRPFPCGAGPGCETAPRPPWGLQRGPRAPQTRAPRHFPPAEPAPVGPPGESWPSRPVPPPPPARALKDILLFLPRTKDNKRSRGVTHRVRAPRSAPLGHSRPSPAPGRLPEPPARTRSSRRGPEKPPQPLPQRRFPRRGPGCPGRLCRGLPARPAARLAPSAAARFPRACGPPGRSSPPTGGHRGRGGTPDSSQCCCLSGHLVPCVWCLSPVSSLGFTPSSSSPSPHTTQHGLFAAAAAAAATAAAAAAAPPRSRPLPSPILPRLPPAAPGSSVHAHHCPPAKAIGSTSFLPPLPSSGLTHARGHVPPA